jgi:hypothetical protein
MPGNFEDARLRRRLEVEPVSYELWWDTELTPRRELANCEKFSVECRAM